MKITSNNVKLLLFIAALMLLPVTITFIMYEIHIKRVYCWLYKRNYFIR